MKLFKTRSFLSLLTVLTVMCVQSLILANKAHAQEPLHPLALEGYDPITYFLNDKASKGSNQYQYIFKGKRYIFANEENQILFASAPQQFLPQFGGNCAHTATSQEPVKGNPSIYKVENGKLFFFSSEYAKANWNTEVGASQVGLVPLALQGYDVTTYFDGNVPTKGSDIFQAVYDGKRYFFTNRSNQEKFAANPERYLPQYGGYCSHAASEGKVLESDPTIFTVEHNKLFLFSELDAKQTYTSKPAEVRETAHKRWNFQADVRNKQIAAKKRWKKENKVTLFTF